MILIDRPTRHPLAPHAPCGHVPHLIEARGRATTHASLLGTPAIAFHVECARCGVATRPIQTARLAELAWRLQGDLVSAKQLFQLRAEAERALANAA